MKKLRKKQFSISWIVKTTKGFRIIELEDYEDQEYKSRVGPSEQKRCWKWYMRKKTTKNRNINKLEIGRVL